MDVEYADLIESNVGLIVRADTMVFSSDGRDGVEITKEIAYPAGRKARLKVVGGLGLVLIEDATGRDCDLYVLSTVRSIACIEVDPKC